MVFAVAISRLLKYGIFVSAPLRMTGRGCRRPGHRSGLKNASAVRAHFFSRVGSPYTPFRGNRNADHLIYDVILQCRRGRADAKTQHQSTPNYLPTSSGTTVSLDGRYQWNRDSNYPYVVVGDSLPLYRAACLVKKLVSDTIIEYLLQRRIQRIVFRRAIFLGSGTLFSLGSWNYFPDTFGYALITGPPDAPYQTGGAERHLQSIKRSFADAQEHADIDLCHRAKLSLAALPRNLTHSAGSTVASTAAVTGKRIRRNLPDWILFFAMRCDG